jgi:hypothetical protein
MHPRYRSTNGFASPLGTEAAVNWVAIADIAAVAVRALVDSSYDGKVCKRDIEKRHRKET